MGTPLRSKSFQDAWYGDMADNTLPDQVAALKQLGERHPWIDTGRAEVLAHACRRDGRTVYWVSNNNLYAAPVDGGALRQLTDIRMEAAPRTPDAQGQRGTLRRQQTELFDVVRDREAQRERDRMDLGVAEIAARRDALTIVRKIDH